MLRRTLLLLLTALLLAPAVVVAQGIAEPNDPEFDRLWALELVGATCAWSRTTGVDTVTVAVVDSGVDLNHPDLVGRVRLDGYDFVDDDAEPFDENGHGTNVAGIVAAALDNAEGVAGLAPGVQILPVRVMDASGYGTDWAIAEGVRYAADQGAQVINLSLGATLTIGAETESELVTSAIRYAQSQGALVVVAAGNDYVPLPNAIVGDNPDVLVVAATDENDRKAPFSNSGPWISVTAPGVHILSTMPTYEVYLTSDELPRDERMRQEYDYMSGTSQAAPYVAALAALLFSANPDWDAQQVTQAIRDNAADISAMNRSLAEKGWIGSGRIDACAALGGPAPQVPVDEPRPDGEPQPADEPAVVAPPVVAPRTNLLILFGVLLCGALLLFGVGLLFVVRGMRGRRPSPAVPAPAPATAPTAGAWGTISVVGGVAQRFRYPLAGNEIVIGRSDDCQIVLVGDPAVSRRHAVVRHDGRQVTIADAGSTHGTYVRGQRVTGPVPVRRGDIIQIGQTTLRFE